MQRRKVTNAGKWDAGVMRSLIRQGNKGKSKDGAPQFPGQQSGLSMQQVREFIMQQPRIQGFRFNSVAGTLPVANIKLPGDAIFFLGVWFGNIADTATFADMFSFSLNNELVIKDSAPHIHWFQNSARPAGNKDNYISYNRPLSGSDVFELNYTSTVANALVTFHIYFI